MAGKVGTTLLVLLLFAASFASVSTLLARGTHVPSHLPVLSVDPHISQGGTDQTVGALNVTVSVSGISAGTGLNSFEFRLSFDNTVLGLDNCLEAQGVPSVDPCDEPAEVSLGQEVAANNHIVLLLFAQNVTMGEIAVNVTMVEPLTVPSILVKIPFSVLRSGHSVMGIHDSTLTVVSPIGSPPVEVRHIDVDGYFQNDNSAFVDVGVSVVATWTNNTLRGVPVTVTVGFENEGTSPSTVTVQVFANATSTSPQTRTIGTASSISLAPGDSKLLNFTWVTTAYPRDTFVIWAKATLSSGTDADPGDNSLAAPGVYQLGAALVDVAVRSLNVTSGRVVAGFPVLLRIMSANLGGQNETVTLRAWANGTLIGQKLGLDLPILSNANVTFLWNTTGLSQGRYVLTAQLMPSPGETALANNNATAFVDVEEQAAPPQQSSSDYTLYYLGGGLAAVAVVVGVSVILARRRRPRV